MKIVGLTGGIGSGKTTITKMFAKLGVPVYIADMEAKKLMHQDKEVVADIQQLLGDEAYQNGILNRGFVANKVFNDQKLLKSLNEIVHPVVAKHFLEWQKKQKSEYVIKEAAILFENDGYKQCDYTILVTAPEQVRIERVLQRDGTSKEEVKSRIKNQWKDVKKIPLADYIINNMDIDKTKQKVLEIHEDIVASCLNNPDISLC